MIDKKIRLIYILLLTPGATHTKMVKAQIKSRTYNIHLQDIIEFVGKHKYKPSHSMIRRIPE